MRPVRTIACTLLVLGSLAHAQVQFFGAIDLGSKGTKADLFSFHDEGCPKGATVKPNFCDVFGRAINTTIVSSMKDGNFTPGGIQEATDAVTQLMSEMQAAAAANKLQKVTYFIVGSSGVAKANNKDALAASVNAALKDPAIKFTFIDARSEGYFGLLDAIPGDKVDVSFFVDIGSGNTKLGCVVGSKLVPANYRGAEIPYGSVSGRNKGADLNSKDIPAGIQQVMRDDVRPVYQRQSMDIPCLQNRERIYWTGGAAWATATFTHPESALEDQVVISRHDIDTFLVKLGDGSWNQKPLQYKFSTTIDPSAKASIEKAAGNDRKRVMDIFAKQDLLSGVSIMKAILDSSNPSAVITFVRSGGDFLLGYARQEYPEALVHASKPPVGSDSTGRQSTTSGQAAIK